MTRRILRYVGNSCAQGLIGYAALIALCEAAYYVQGMMVRMRRGGC